MPDFDLSITICSWNTLEDLRVCLASLVVAQEDADFEVIVIDNASTDGSPDMVEKEFPQFRLLRQSENLGFTGGHNVGIKARRGRDIALLNSDTIVRYGAIRRMMQYMRDTPTAGIIGAKLLNPDGSLQFSCRSFPNPVAAAFRGTILGRLFPNNRFTREYLMTDWHHDDPRKVDWVSGAALFVRGEVIDELGGLDPKFFMYCEDVDLCKRCAELGFDVMYLPDAIITHAIGRSTDKVANKMIVRFHRSMLRYYAKHTLPKSFVLLRPLLYIAAVLALSARATMFLLRNFFDAIRRKLGMA